VVVTAELRTKPERERRASADLKAALSPGRLRTPSPWAYLIAPAILIGGISIYPLVELVRIAFSNVGPSNLIGSWPWVGFANLSTEIHDPALWAAAKVTLELTAMLLVSDLVIGFVVASVLVDRSRSTSALLSLMTFVWALPPLVSGSVWKFLLASGGPVNGLLGDVGMKPVDWLASPHLALWSVGLVTSWAALPFATLVLRGGMLSVPADIVEAAAVDGARYWQTQIRVVLPQLRPTITILAVLAVLYSFQGFNFIFAMTSGGPGAATQNIPFLAYQKAFTTFDLSAGGAIALLAMAVIIVLAIPYTLSVRHEEQA
jgi:multiple sugar transport system permease protein